MPRPSQSAKAPAKAPSASTPTKASGKKRARDDTDADVETTTPKRQRVKKASTTESESATNADAPSTPTSTRKTRTPAKRPAKQTTGKKAPIVMPTLAPIPEESVTSAGPSDAASSTPAPAPKKRGKKTVAFESPVVTASATADDARTPPPATSKTRTPKKSTTTPRKSTPRASTRLTRSATKAANSSTDMAVAGDEAATPVQKKKAKGKAAGASADAPEASTPVPKKTAAQAKKLRGKAAGTSEDAPKASTPAPKKTAAPKKAATSKKTATPKKTAIPKRATKRELTTDPEEPTETPRPKRLRTKSPVAESSASTGESSASAAAEEASNTSTNLPGPSVTSSGRDPVEVSDLAELLQQGPSTRRKTSRKPRRRLVSKKELNAATATAAKSESEQADTSSVIYKNAGEKRIHEETFRRVDEDSTPRPVKRAKTKPSSSIDLVPQQSARSIDSTTSTTASDIQDTNSLADEELSDSGIDVASQPSASDQPDNDAAAATYPSTCLYQNTALNPLQARVPKKARLHLRHSSAADASAADGIVPVSLRRLLRCSIRVQTLYARHGLAGMDDAELPLPAWVARETAFSYETYVSTKHNHIWATTTSGSGSSGWWTAQRLLDLYALALYMQDPDCCDAVASAMVRMVRGAAADDVEEEPIFELDVAAFLQQLDWLADLVSDDDDDDDRDDYDDDEKLHLPTVALASSAPIRALLLDLLSAPPHAAATLKALSNADALLYAEGVDPFFTDLRNACRTRVNSARTKRSAVPSSPMFMAQERKWCERYHFHAHWFPLDDAELLFPPSSAGEDDPSVADRGCHALRALRLAEDEGEQMPEARGEREVWEEEKRMYEAWQGVGIEGYEIETFECSRARLGDGGKWRVGPGDDGGVEIVMKEDY